MACLNIKVQNEDQQKLGFGQPGEEEYENSN